MGLAHCEPLVRGDEPKRRKSAKAGDETNEARRWERGASAAHELFPGAVHVMDREADSYVLLESMLVRRQDFVVRLSYRDRRADGGLRHQHAARRVVAAGRAVVEEGNAAPGRAQARHKA